MLIGQTLVAGADPGAIYYSPWIPRQGDKVEAAAQFFRKSGSLGTFAFAFQTKNREDSDSPSSLTTLIASKAIGVGSYGEVTSEVAEGCLELVRFKFTLAVESSVEWVHFRAMPLIWAAN